MARICSRRDRRPQTVNASSTQTLAVRVRRGQGLGIVNRRMQRGAASGPRGAASRLLVACSVRASAFLSASRSVCALVVSAAHTTSHNRGHQHRSDQPLPVCVLRGSSWLSVALHVLSAYAGTRLKHGSALTCATAAMRCVKLRSALSAPSESPLALFATAVSTPSAGCTLNSSHL